MFYDKNPNATDKTRERILSCSVKLFADVGFENFSMRTLADRVGIAQSVVYHYFKSKEDLLEVAFDTTRKALGAERYSLTLDTSLYDDIKQRINFQFDNALEVTFILKYYLSHRHKFEKNSEGYVPKTAYKHILEVLQKAQKQNTMKELDIDEEAKVITHAINGFVLEYYPEIPTRNERRKVVNSLANFINRSISVEGGEENAR